ncbi:beta-glucanase [Colletotrichum sublineola]|uniref:Putative beta-glucanase n=1 Tax=Colletotrichum sublineola TaxID=1173701 RepID=A0A066XD51_COLSU|nr:beta-glucanase [Colletotrichum sublineola]KDN67103.1 putative beta-glucanase [Colletotrichum sublineola]
MGFVKTVKALAIALPAVNAVAPPTIQGYNLAWSDDFSGAAGTLPNASNWIFTTGTSYPGGAAHFGTGEIETYTDNVANVQLSGKDTLQITAIKDSSGAWTSSRIETQRTDFAPAAGQNMLIQASLSLPNMGTNGLGYWPAFWALGSSFRGNYTNWPECGELDIMENVNSADKAWGTMHCDTSPGGACNEKSGLSSNLTCAGSSCTGNFHTYTIVVDRSSTPESVHWYLDEVEYWSVSETQMTEAIWAQTVQVPYYLILNLAIGGEFPDNNSGSTTPTADTASGGVFEAEYVAVYYT